MSLLRFIIYGNFLVSLSAGTLTFGVSRYLLSDDSLLYALCAFFATLFIYNLQRLLRFSEVKNQTSDRHKWLVRNKKLVILLCIIGGVGALTSYLILGLRSDVFMMFGLSVLGFLYAYGGAQKKALRDVPFIKIYLIMIVWSLVSVLWPAYRENVLTVDIIYLLLVVGFYIFAATIPFDVRDLSYDSDKHKTIPQIIGVSTSKLLSVTLLLVSAGIICFLDSSFLSNPFFYTAYIGMVTLSLLTHRKRQEMFFSGLIDGWIIWFGLMFYLISF